MKLVKDKKLLDGIIFRCTRRGINKHDNRINIKNGSIFEKIKVDIRMLYFLIFIILLKIKVLKTHI